jgi:hypothetical protein
MPSPIYMTPLNSIPYNLWDLLESLRFLFNSAIPRVNWESYVVQAPISRLRLAEILRV